jgi:hypothetical protein
MEIASATLRRQAPPRRGLALFASLLTLLLFVGCGGIKDAMRGYGKSAAEGMAEGLPAMKEPAKKLLREALLEGDTLKQATDQATAAAVRALTRELGDAEVQTRVDGLVEHTLQLLAERGGETTRTLVRNAGPELREALRAAVVKTMGEAGTALKDSVEKQLMPATQLLAQRTAEVLVETLVKALDGPLGKKLEQSAGQMGQRLISDAATELAAPASKLAVAQFTESATRGAVRGARAEVSEGLSRELQAALIAGLIVLGTLLVLAAGGAVLLWRRYQQSTTSLAIIAQKINEKDAKDLKRAIKQSAADNHVGPWLSTFLKHRGL